MADVGEELCKVCEQTVGKAHKCEHCKHFVHIFCGKTIGEEGYGQEVICFVCSGSKEKEKGAKKSI